MLPCSSGDWFLFCTGILLGDAFKISCSFPFWRRKDILSIQRVWILNWETWTMLIIMFITFGNKLVRATFWKQFSFIIPSMLLVLAQLQVEVFPSGLGFFFLKRSNQLRVVIIICCVFKVVLPVGIRLKIVTFKLLKNNQVVLSTTDADLSAFLHLCTFTLGEGIKLVCFAFLTEDSLPMLCGEAVEGLQPDFQRYQMLKDRETEKILKFFSRFPWNDQN